MTIKFISTCMIPVRDWRQGYDWKGVVVGGHVIFLVLVLVLVLNLNLN